VGPNRYRWKDLFLEEEESRGKNIAGKPCLQGGASSQFKNGGGKRGEKVKTRRNLQEN